MSTVADDVGGRVDVSLASAGLLLGDLAAIAVFVVIGEFSHANDPFANPMLAVETYVPFAIGWLVVSVPAGLYGRRAFGSALRVAALTLGAWFLGDVIAQALRATTYFRGNAAVTFFLVSFGFAGALLVAWRVGVTVVSSRRRSRAPA